MNTSIRKKSPFAGNVANQFFIDRRNIMRTRSGSKWLQLIACILMLLTTFAPSPAQADGPLTGGIVSVGAEHTCALRSDGSVDCWGNLDYGAAEDQPGPYIQVSAGGADTCALTPSGAADC